MRRLTIHQERLTFLLVLAIWILIGLYFIGCQSTLAGSIHEQEYDLSNPKECVSHFMLMFSEINATSGGGFGVSADSASLSRDSSQGSAGTNVSPKELSYISTICYLEDSEVKASMLECIESVSPCPISSLMSSCPASDRTSEE